MNIINPRYEYNYSAGIMALDSGNIKFTPEYGIFWNYTHDEIIIENKKIKFNPNADICPYIAIIIDKNEDIFIDIIRIGEESDENIYYNFYDRIQLDNKIIFIYSIRKVHSATFKKYKYHNIILNKPYIGNINILFCCLIWNFNTFL